MNWDPWTSDKRLRGCNTRNAITLYCRIAPHVRAVAAHNSGSRNACGLPDTVLGNGSGSDFEGGCLACRGGFFDFLRFAKTREEAQELADSDPFNARGLRRYELLLWQVNEGSFEVRLPFSAGKFVID
jgi:hypothetical protein